MVYGLQYGGDDTVLLTMTLDDDASAVVAVAFAFAVEAGSRCRLDRMPKWMGLREVLSPRQAHAVVRLCRTETVVLYLRGQVGGGSKDLRTWCTSNWSAPCSVRLRDAARSDADVLPSATDGWSFEMVARKAGSVLGGRWGSKLGGRKCEAAMQWEQLTPANMLFVTTGCHFRKVTRSEPGPAPSTVPRYTLCIYRYIEEMPARLCSSFSACVCTTIVLHPRTNLLASLECQSSPSSNSRFKWMRRPADASQSVSQSIETPMSA